MYVSDVHLHLQRICVSNCMKWKLFTTTGRTLFKVRVTIGPECVHLPNEVLSVELHETDVVFHRVFNAMQV